MISNHYDYQYTVIMEPSGVKFKKMVEEHWISGWEFVGGVSQSEHGWCQAMRRVIIAAETFPELVGK